VKMAEVIVASIIVAGGALVIFDSLRLGARWAGDGPQAGYFPFYVAMILAGACLFGLGLQLRAWPEEVGAIRHYSAATFRTGSTVLTTIRWTFSRHGCRVSGDMQVYDSGFGDCPSGDGSAVQEGRCATSAVVIS